MKTNTIKDGGGGRGGTPPELELLLAYEDRPTAERAKLAVARVLSEPGVEAQPEFHPWRLDVLGVPELREQATKEAAAADILVVSMHGKNRLASEAEVCLRQWVGTQRAKPCALVISLDPDAKPLAENNPALTELRAAAVRSGMTVLLQFGEPPRSDMETATIADIQHRANATSDVLDGIMRYSGSYRDWGINE